MNRKVIALSALGVVLLAVGGGIAAKYMFFDQASYDEQTASSGPQTHAVPESEDAAAKLTAKKDHVKSLVRQLGIAQDGVAYGLSDALIQQGNVINDIANSLEEIDVQSWIEPPDFKSILVYVLSGGEPAVLQRFVDARIVAAHDQTLAEGVLNFAENNPEKSRESLSTIEPRLLEATLMGPVSLAKASLYAKNEPAKAIELLDDARLINPHTAIEEAAVRRQVPLLMTQGQRWRGMMLAIDYIHRFGRSAYSPSFLEEFAKIYVGQLTVDSEDDAKDFAGAIDHASNDARLEALLAMSREALVKGRLNFARFMAKEALSVPGPTPLASSRAKLYLAASNAPTEAAAAANDSLQQLASSELSDEDAGIRHMASDIATSVIRRPREATGNGSTPVNKRLQMESASRALSIAENSLKEADRMIEGSSK